MQVIYQIIRSYFEDERADELTNEPVMTAILEKDALASQPTLSRFFTTWRKIPSTSQTRASAVRLRRTDRRSVKSTAS